MRFAIRTNVADLAKDLDDLAKKQIPFATALALTNAAKDVRRHLRDTLTDYFTVRGQWVPRSIQIDQANKKDAAPHAIVGTLYEPMALQAEGGEKRGRAGHDVAIPMAARGSNSDRTTPSQWPGNLLKKKGFHLVEMDNSRVGVVQSFKKAPDKLWWLLVPEVRVEPRWPFEKLAREEVERELVDNFWAAMERAVATARPRTG